MKLLIALWVTLNLVIAAWFAVDAILAYRKEKAGPWCSIIIFLTVNGYALFLISVGCIYSLL